ncbi:hypothetical protein DQ237_01920 [Blastococcus sp. TF02-8]|uniref:hypothetical protein n=1 Tax=Blastococcus sp. TF02-8 TaxID=2250574 RepID=UPI000DE8B257|nr:hypothetical protein [Blastococcus sp. TF02-8]RBY97707.1 hypothetical protein DQ237_01920 [Blastococcus sp. TF02-8]
MDSPAPRPQAEWMVQPLVEAGLRPAEIRTLVTRLCFETVVSDGVGPARLLDLVEDRSPAIRTAWVRVIDRMIDGTPPAR